jgi:MFS family permease
VRRTAPGLAAPLRVAEFRALWFAEAQSVAGDQLAKVALTLLVYSTTNSALWAAVVYALTFLPALAGGLGLSQLADRYPRRSLLTACALVQAALVGVMAIPGMPLAALCGLVVAVQLVQSPLLAAQNAATRDAFDDDELYLRSQDLRGITTNTTMLLGLAGGGLLVTAIGTSWALLVNAATFLVTAVLVHRVVKARPAAARPGDGWFAGARWVAGQRRMRVLLTLSWLVGLAVVPEGLAAPLAEEVGAGPAAVGWLLAADPLGFVVGAFLLSRYVPAHLRTKTIGVLAACSVGLLIAFLAHPNLYVALLLLALTGMAGAYQITVVALFNSWIPNEIRGGVMGVARTGLRVAQGIGIALGGAVAEMIGSVSHTIAAAGVLGVVIAIPATIEWARIHRGAGDTTQAGNVLGYQGGMSHG